MTMVMMMLVVLMTVIVVMLTRMTTIMGDCYHICQTGTPQILLQFKQRKKQEFNGTPETLSLPGTDLNISPHCLN